VGFQTTPGEKVELSVKINHAEFELIKVPVFQPHLPRRNGVPVALALPSGVKQTKTPASAPRRNPSCITVSMTCSQVWFTEPWGAGTYSDFNRRIANVFGWALTDTQSAGRALRKGADSKSRDGSLRVCVALAAAAPVFDGRLEPPCEGTKKNYSPPPIFAARTLRLAIFQPSEMR